MTSSVIWLRRSSKAFAKTKLAPKKGHGHCFVVCCWSDSLQLSLILVKPLHLRSMLSKSTRWAGSCNARSQHSSTERARLLSPTVPDHTAHNQGIKSLTNRASKVCFICHIHLTSHQPTTTCSSISTIFCRENISTTSKRQRMLSKSSLNPKTQTFILQELASLFLVGKTMLILMVPILIY